MLSRVELKALQKRRDYPSVSILVPTYRTAPANKQDRIKVKNHVKKAVDRLHKEFPSWRRSWPISTSWSGRWTGRTRWTAWPCSTARTTPRECAHPHLTARPKSPLRLRQALWMWLAGFLAESAWTLRNSTTKVGPWTR